MSRFLSRSAMVFALALVALLSALPRAASAQTCQPSDILCNDQPDRSPPTVFFISPGSLTLAGNTPTQAVTLTLGWCDDGGLNGSSARVTFGGTTYTPGFTYGSRAGCASYGTSSLTLTFQNGQNKVLTYICDNSSKCGQDSATFNYTYTPPNYTVSAGPDGGVAYAGGSTVRPVEFTVTNTGTGGASYALDVACTLPAASCVPSDTLVALSAGGSARVTVSYAMGAGSGPGRVRLRATRSGGTESDSAWIHVRAPSYGVTLSPDGSAAGLPTDSTVTQVFTLVNTGTGSATYTLALSCTGQVGSCTSTPGASVTAAPGQAVPVSVSFRTASTAGTGRVRLLATRSGGTEADSAWLGVTVVARGGQVAPVVTLADPNPGTSISRGLCLTMPASDGAYECGDLRLAYALPATATMGKARAPTLLYNSQHGHPAPIVGAHVLLPVGAARPDSVTAALYLGQATTPVAAGKWAGSGWGATGGTVRRIALTWDALAYATGVYDYRMAVTSWYGATAKDAAPVAGRLVIVNRSQSPFRPGWWLAGLEQLLPQADGSKLWIGGDGSTRLYLPAGSSAWAAESVTRPDTLKYEAATQRFVRLLPGGARVEFDSDGRHVATVNRTRDTTRFAYRAPGSRILTSITLPVDSAATAPQYLLSYTATDSLLQRVDAPQAQAGVARPVTLSANPASYLMTITGPSGTFIYYDEPQNPNRMVGYLDPMGYKATYGWRQGTLAHTSRFMKGLGTDTANLVTTFYAAEVYGLAALGAAADTALAYTVVDGPRTDVDDRTRIWVDRFGSPRRIQDPLGNVTQVERGDTRFPALATRTEGPGAGGTQLAGTAVYDARGNVASTLQVNPLGDGRDATSYAERSDPRWPDFVTRSVNAEGLVSETAYDSVGNRIWEQAGLDPLRRVKYTYSPRGQVETVISQAAEARGDSAEKLFYDALGNLRRTESPLGSWAEQDRDGAGRVIRTRTPIDGVLVRRDSTVYDAAGRVILQVSDAPAVSTAAGSGQTHYAPAERLVVRTAYDLNGRTVRVDRWSVPDSAKADTITTRWEYDRAGRVIAEFAPDSTPANTADNPVTRTVYDHAGNVIRSITRTGEEITFGYDVANRMVSRSVPAAVRRTAPDQVGSVYWRFPRYRPDANGAFETAVPQVADTTEISVPGEEATFDYDAVGNLLRARNGDAWVSRTYYPNGLLRTDTLRIRTYAGADFSTHAYTLEYGYDLLGRRTSLKHPANLAPSGPGWGLEQRYEYDGTTGQLSRVTGLDGGKYDYAYNAEGQTESLQRGSSTIEQFTYDADGRLKQRMETAQSALMHNDGYTYDERGKVMRVSRINKYTANAYSGLGSLVRTDELPSSNLLLQPEVTEQFALDAMGNQLSSFMEQRGATQAFTYDVSPVETTRHYERGTGRLRGSRLQVRTNTPSVSTDTSVYDRAGNRVAFWSAKNIETPYVSQGTTYAFLLESMKQYYAPDGKLKVVDRRTCLLFAGECDPTKQPVPGSRSAFEEYRYDALGRRVLVRTRQEFACTINCQNALRRTVWDGDQVLYEVSAPGWTGAADTLMEKDTAFYVPATMSAVITGGTPDPKWIDPPEDAYRGFFYGRVMYTHGMGTDAPLSWTRMEYSDSLHRPYTVIPHADWRGSYDLGSWTGGYGTVPPCKNILVTFRLREQVWEPGRDTTTSAPHYAEHCIRVNWPAPHLWITQSARSTNMVGDVAWNGSLLDGQRDASGQMYRRNRYYDPQSGRFTQEDPIGLAGGINLYGYANGDPVSYSDPYGLAATSCPKEEYVVPCPEEIILRIAQAATDALKVITDAVGITDLGEAATGVSADDGESLGWGRRAFKGAMFAVSVTPEGKIGRVLPTMPAKILAQGGEVVVEHYYRSGDHGPAHAHVRGGGPTTRIGQNGHPLRGDPELTAAQRRVIAENRSAIRRAIRKLGRILSAMD